MPFKRWSPWYNQHHSHSHKANINESIFSSPFSSFLVLIVLVFIAGTVVMSLEFAASRLLVPVFGSSIYTWGSLIGVILAGLSLGYYIGGKLADGREPSFVKFCSIIFSAGLYIVFVPFISPAVISYSSISPVAGIEEGRYASLLAAFFLLTVPMFLLGIVSPYAIKLATKTLSRLGNMAGNLYSAATIGSIVGTFVTVFFLIPTFEINYIIFGLGLSLIISAALTGLIKRIIPKILVGSIVLFLFLSSTFLVVNPVPYYSGNLVYSRETPYSHLDVVDLDQNRALFLDGIIHSIMNKSDPNTLVIDYTKFFPIGLLFNPDAKNVLFVGGGGFSGPKHFLKTYTNMTVDVVEIDPDVIDVAEKYFNLDTSDPRLNIYNDDARNFLQSTDKKYDIIILDAYSKNYVPFHLMTLEYFQLLSSRLASPDGVIISHNVGSLDEREDTSYLFRALYKTVSRVFPAAVYVFPIHLTDLTENSAQNIIVVAAKAPEMVYNSKDDIRLMQTQYYKRTDPLSMNNSSQNNGDGIIDYAARLYDSVRIETGDVPLLTDQFAPVENLLNPLTSRPIDTDGGDGINRKIDLYSVQGIFITIVFPVVIAITWIFYMQKIWIRKVRLWK